MGKHPEQIDNAGAEGRKEGERRIRRDEQWRDRKTKGLGTKRRKQEWRQDRKEERFA